MKFLKFSSAALVLVLILTGYSEKKDDNSKFISELKKNKENEWFIHDKLLYFRRQKIKDLFLING